MESRQKIMPAKRSKGEKEKKKAKRIPEICCLRTEENDQMVSNEFLKHCRTISSIKQK